MFEELVSPEQLVILGQIIFIDLVLAGDNAIIIGMIASKFPLDQRKKIILESETFKKYAPEEYRPGININDDEELVKEASNYAQTIFHPVGTCKMGQDNMAVVDEKLRVKGINNLRVIDASIMPNITSGNTNAPTIMIAEKGADMILEH